MNHVAQFHSLRDNLLLPSMDLKQDTDAELEQTVGMNDKVGGRAGVSQEGLAGRCHVTLRLGVS